MGITIVICTHNRAALLRQTLLRLSQAKLAPDAAMDVLVVANACSDDTHALLAELESAPIWNNLPLHWISEPTPGKSYALNRSISETTADFLCFIDDDQFVATDFLQVLLNTVTIYPEYDIFCGKINPAWDGSEPSWVHETGKYYIPIRPFPEYDFGDTPKEIGPGHKLPSGGNITLRRMVFQQVGKFSCELGPQGHNLMGGEDIEFLQRCIANGHHILYMPTLQQLHMIEQERMSKRYMLRKSYLRSLSSQLMRDSPHSLRPYMFLKILQHGVNALFTLSANRRFYYLMRLAASFGELHAAAKT